MTEKKRGLRRGVDALLGASRNKAPAPAPTPLPTVEPAPAAEAPAPQEGALKYLPIEFIQPGKYQPRIDMRQESLEELALSIKAQGLMQPIVVRPLTSS